jgi:magnesium transporter
VSALWFQDPMIGVVIALAMLLNLINAALAGVLVPLTLRRLNIDPALAGGVVVTTFTDVVGFLSFLGLGTLLLLKP